MTSPENTTSDDLAGLTERYARSAGDAKRLPLGLHLASALGEKGSYLEAIRVLQEILPAARTKEERAQVLRKRGWINLRLSQYDKAYQFLGEALELLSASNSLDLFGVYYDIAWMFYRQGYIENARNYCDGARQVLAGLVAGDARAASQAQLDLLHITALIEAADGNHEAAAAHLAAEIATHRASGDQYRLAGACNKLASVTMATGDVIKALEYQAQAHDVSQRSGEVFRLALSHKNYGDIYYVIGDLDRSLEHYRESLRIAQEIHNRLGEVFAGAGIGKVLGCRGDCQAAARQMESALAAARELGNRDRETCILVDLAEVHCLCRRAADAMSCLESADGIEAQRGQQHSPRHQLVKARALLLRRTRVDNDQAGQIAEQLLAAPIRIDDEEMVSVPELRIAARLVRAEVLRRRGQADQAKTEAAAAAADIDAFCAPLDPGQQALFRAKPAIAEVEALRRQPAGTEPNQSTASVP